MNADSLKSSAVSMIAEARERQALEARLAASERFIRAITDNVPVRLAYFDLKGRLQFVNRVLCERFSLRREQMIGRTLAEITQSDRPSPVAEHYKRAMTGEAQRFEYPDVMAGQTRHILTQLIPDVSADGTVQGVFGVGVDISAEVAVRDELDRQTATLNAMIEVVPAMMTVWDMDQRCRLVNRAFESWAGASRDQMIGKTLQDIIGPAEYERSRPWVDRVLAGETVSFEKEYCRPSGNKHFTLSYIPMRLQDGRIVGFTAIGQDITPHREENLRLSLLSQRDPLTGLLNRSGLQEFMINTLQHGAGASLAVIYIDLDHFKPINDTHGHATGDEVLREFSTRLLCLVRPTDAVARLGGDEFVIAIAGLPQMEAARAIADKVVQVAKLPIRVGQLTLTVGASVGVAMNADSAGGWKELIAQADARAYEAKAAGRGRLSIT